MTNNGYTITELNKEIIKSLIHEIRGQKVMLDFDLAKIYGYDTRSFNQQVKRNVNKFPERYRFQLTKEEISKISRSQNVMSIMQEKGQKGGRVYYPYAFTEQGIYMLMTVLKGDLATKQSILLIDTFKQMKDYLIENKNILTTDETIKLTNLVNEHSNRLDKIEEKLEVVMDNFKDPSKYKHYLIKDGEKLEADVAYQEIYKLAKKSIYIIDDYINVKTLQLLKVCSSNIDIIIISDNKARNNINQNYLDDFKHDMGFDIILKQNNSKFHDRYIVIDFNTDDYKIFHCGASSKDSGKSINTIIEIKEKELYVPLIEKALR